MLDAGRYGLNSKEKFALAISGGSDSTALCFLCQQAKLNFTAIIVDHKFRKESTKEANDVKKYLISKLKLKADRVVILTNKKPIPKTNIEEFLRDVRQELIFAYCEKNNIKKILTAHHLDDQIETFLMRLERGSGLDGLAGIKEFAVHSSQFADKEFTIIRPLLSFSKEELKELLVKNKIKWWEDKTNKDTKHTRNNIRVTLEGFSDYPLIRKRLSGVIENITRAAEFIELEKEKAFSEIVNISKKEVSVNLTKYKKLHTEIRLRILRDLVKKYSQTKKPVRMDNIKNLDAMFLDNGFKATTLQGIKIVKKKPDIAVFE